MKVIIFGNGQQAQDLHEKVMNVLEEIGLTDFVELTKSEDEVLKTELKITQNPALIIEEESIDFKDMIFEGMVPESGELSSMFMSIIWGGGHDHSEWGGCGTGGCGSGCSC